MTRTPVTGPPESPTSLREVRPPEDPLDAPFRILVVDDEDGTRDVLETALVKQGYDVSVAANGRAALQQLDSEQFDLLIADIRMPEPNGITLLGAVHERAPETVVVLMTGYATLDVAIQAIREGAYDFLAKPFHIDELYLVVRNALERTTLIRQNRRLLHELEQTYRKINEALAVRRDRSDSARSDLESLHALRQQVLRLYASSTGSVRPAPARQYGRYRADAG